MDKDSASHKDAAGGKSPTALIHKLPSTSDGSVENSLVGPEIKKLETVERNSIGNVYESSSEKKSPSANKDNQPNSIEEQKMTDVEHVIPSEEVPSSFEGQVVSFPEPVVTTSMKEPSMTTGDHVTRSTEPPYCTEEQETTAEDSIKVIEVTAASDKEPLEAEPQPTIIEPSEELTSVQEPIKPIKVDPPPTVPPPEESTSTREATMATEDDTISVKELPTGVTIEPATHLTEESPVPIAESEVATEKPTDTVTTNEAPSSTEEVMSAAESSGDTKQTKALVEEPTLTSLEPSTDLKDLPTTNEESLMTTGEPMKHIEEPPASPEEPDIDAAEPTSSIAEPVACLEQPITSTVEPTIPKEDQTGVTSSDNQHNVDMDLPETAMSAEPEISSVKALKSFKQGSLKIEQITLFASDASNGFGLDDADACVRVKLGHYQADTTTLSDCRSWLKWSALVLETSVNALTVRVGELQVELWSRDFDGGKCVGLSSISLKPLMESLEESVELQSSVKDLKGKDIGRAEVMLRLMVTETDVSIPTEQSIETPGIPVNCTSSDLPTVVVETSHPVEQNEDEPPKLEESSVKAPQQSLEKMEETVIAQEKSPTTLNEVGEGSSKLVEKLPTEVQPTLVSPHPAEKQNETPPAEDEPLVSGKQGLFQGEDGMAEEFEVQTPLALLHALGFEVGSVSVYDEKDEAIHLPDQTSLIFEEATEHESVELRKKDPQTPGFPPVVARNEPNDNEEFMEEPTVVQMDSVELLKKSTPRIQGDDLEFEEEQELVGPHEMRLFEPPVDISQPPLGLDGGASELDVSVDNIPDGEAVFLPPLDVNLSDEELQAMIERMNTEEVRDSLYEIITKIEQADREVRVQEEMKAIELRKMREECQLALNEIIGILEEQEREAAEKLYQEILKKSEEQQLQREAEEKRLKEEQKKKEEEEEEQKRKEALFPTESPTEGNEVTEENKKEAEQDLVAIVDSMEQQETEVAGQDGSEKEGSGETKNENETETPVVETTDNPPENSTENETKIENEADSETKADPPTLVASGSEKIPFTATSTGLEALFADVEDDIEKVEVEVGTEPPDKAETCEDTVQPIPVVPVEAAESKPELAEMPDKKLSASQKLRAFVLGSGSVYQDVDGFEEAKRKARDMADKLTKNKEEQLQQRQQKQQRMGSRPVSRQDELVVRAAAYEAEQEAIRLQQIKEEEKQARFSRKGKVKGYGFESIRAGLSRHDYEETILNSPIKKPASAAQSSSKERFLPEINSGSSASPSPRSRTVKFGTGAIDENLESTIETVVLPDIYRNKSGSTDNQSKAYYPPRTAPAGGLSHLKMNGPNGGTEKTLSLSKSTPGPFSPRKGRSEGSLFLMGEGEFEESLGELQSDQLLRRYGWQSSENSPSHLSKFY